VKIDLHFLEEGGKPLARRKISFARGNHYCSTFFIFIFFDRPSSL